MMTKDRKFHVTQCLLGLFLGGTVWCWSQDDPAPIPIAELDREEPVDFVKEIYPLLKQNCIACHGLDGAGNALIGAPRINDDIWLYGGDLDTLKTTLRQGHFGIMPAFDSRLDDFQIKLRVALLAR